MVTSQPPSPQRFVPGSIVDERYRIVALLGRGGMGEVYRADDLKLEQPVALKFLPEDVAHSPEHLRRFLQEVKVARQVSHPNICRVHDVGEVDGQHYISMEYVDGEDLASLLRRIGRLPPDKAVEIARQMCAGLSAAHEQGILHRDMKPANVMIDGDGGVRIADFGLAAAISQLEREDAMVGTPKYMAPEQLAGEEVTKASDIYSLGLVLFELFTGKPAFDSQTLDELMLLRQDASNTPRPATHLRDIDPTVEAVIERCLAHDPSERPDSAFEVAMALPGADPLEAALAAGETPSPRLVAAAGGVGSLRPWVGGVFVAVIVVGLIVISIIDRQAFLIEIVKPELPPSVLEHRAREIAKSFGYDLAGEAHRDRSFSFIEQIKAEFANDPSPDRWDRLRLPYSESIRFAYRESPAYLIPENAAGRVTWSRPPQDVAGMWKMSLSFDGKLLGFSARPSFTKTRPEKDVDWTAAFQAAGFDIQDFREIVVKDWVQEQPTTLQRTWSAAHPDIEGGAVYVYTGEFRGQPTNFVYKSYWNLPKREPAGRRALIATVMEIAGMIALGICLLGGGWMGFRNLTQGRGDYRNATYIAVYLFTLSMLRWLLVAEHVPDADRVLPMLARAAAQAAWYALLAWFLYVALEPTVRRTWPRKLVSWNRLLIGRFRDPLLGRDVLMGLVGAVVGEMIAQIYWVSVASFTDSPPFPHRMDQDLLLGPSHVVANLLSEQADAGLLALMVVFLLVFLKTVVRRMWIAVSLLLLLGLAAPVKVYSDFPVMDLLAHALQMITFVVVVVRGGVFAVLVMAFGASLIRDTPLTLDFGAWYSGPAIAAWTLLLGLAGYGLVTAIRRQ